jgi:hypothetical protein
MSVRSPKDRAAAARVGREDRERATKALARRAADWQQRQPLSYRQMQLVPVSDTDTRTRRGRPRKHKWVRARGAA